jgi:phosphoribosylanthranilate isomerase
MAAKLKVCGVTRPEDLAACALLGVDAVGINLWKGSRRGLTLAQAKALIDEVRPPRSLERVGVFGFSYLWVVRGTPTALQVPTPAPRRVLLDAAVAGFGGAGQTTDWQWAARAVRELAPHEVWLAGGITPANAAAALQQVRPAGLDVASGTELPGATRGEKDGAAIAALMAICRAVS